MKLIVGLGNPGEKYVGTRHNIGFDIVDALRKELEFEKFNTDKKFTSLASTGHLEEEKIMIVKPQTYMNLSGTAVQGLLEFYKINPENLWVVYDDIDLSFAQIRIRKEGSPGTHNGIKNITNLIGTDKFPRLRFGIESRGETAPEQQDTSSFVLSKFLPEEESKLTEKIATAINALKKGIIEGPEAAMNQYNG